MNIVTESDTPLNDAYHVGRLILWGCFNGN